LLHKLSTETFFQEVPKRVQGSTLLNPIQFNLWGVVKVHTGGDSPRTSPLGGAEQAKFLYRRLQSGWKKKVSFRARFLGGESFFLSPTTEGVYL